MLISLPVKKKILIPFIPKVNDFLQVRKKTKLKKNEGFGVHLNFIFYGKNLYLIFQN